MDVRKLVPVTSFARTYNRARVISDVPSSHFLRGSNAKAKECRESKNT